ncbi:hypothetical protein GCM10027416_05810 [Okibacterium endophyticum]
MAERNSIVSVALCTFNGAGYLGEQLRSILNQTTPPDEIVISDDGSTDATLDIVGEVLGAARVHHRVLRNTTSLGVTGNFERAIRETRGDVIVLCDQDDVWHPDRIERALAEFTDRPDLALLFADARMVDAAGTPLGYRLFDALEISEDDRRLLHGGRGFEVLLRRNLATGATVAFRRALLDVALPFPAEWVHDEWLAILAAATMRVDMLDEPLVDYRQHGRNEIGMREPSLRQKIGRVLQHRGSRNRDIAARTGALVEKLASLGDRVQRADLTAARGKLRIERMRAELPPNRLARVVPVLREARSGDYERYTSQGRREILRDLLQPE